MPDTKGFSFHAPLFAVLSNVIILPFKKFVHNIAVVFFFSINLSVFPS